MREKELGTWMDVWNYVLTFSICNTRREASYAFVQMVLYSIEVEEIEWTGSRFCWRGCAVRGT